LGYLAAYVFIKRDIHDSLYKTKFFFDFVFSYATFDTTTKYEFNEQIPQHSCLTLFKILITK